MDIYSMIYDVLKESFPAVQEFDRMSFLEEYPYCYGQTQTKLGMWFIKTNRYGQAVLIATEALRSYLVPIYLLQKDQKISREKYANDVIRAKVDNMAQELTDWNLLDSRSRQMLRRFPMIRNLRNVFAHNIPDKESYETDVVDPKKEIEAYYDALNEFGVELEEKWGEIEKRYSRSKK